MSFGFSVGDFIVLLELANRVRKQFIDAPHQFTAISDECRSLSSVLFEADVVLSTPGASAQQSNQAKTIIESCRALLEEISSSVESLAGVTEQDGSATSKAKRMWQRLKWDAKTIEGFRSRISSNVPMLNGIISQQTQQNILVVRGGVDKLVDRKETQHRMKY